MVNEGSVAETFEADMSVGNEMLRQLGGRRFMMMVGAKQPIWNGDKNELGMKIGRNSIGANYFVIRLNPRDLYDLRFESRRMNRKTYEMSVKVKAEHNDVYADQLQEIFENTTGLYTRMAETFEAPMKGAQPPRKGNTADGIYLTGKHTKAIRNALKERFPDLKIRIKKGGSSVIIHEGHSIMKQDPIRKDIEKTIHEAIKDFERNDWGWTPEQGSEWVAVSIHGFPTGGNAYQTDFDAETFEAREKKIGSIRIVKNPNFPSGTSLQAYIKTNRAELRKVFGNPNMGESGDGKSKGKEWNLIVGSHRVTIYDRREMDKKGTKYFNIGGSGKYGALLVAQALSIHRNERVYAKETVPQWLEDKRQFQQVKSIDEHPDLTYERAKEYEDNRVRYRAENLEAEDELITCEWCYKTIGTEEEMDDDHVEWNNINGETICGECDAAREQEGDQDLDPHYTPFYAETFENKDLLKWIEDYLWDNDKKGYQAYHAHRKSLGLSAEERKKRSSLLSEPHEGTSLDSGEWKGILTGFGIGLLGLFGYSKLRK